MVNSLTFNGQSGYITSTIPEPDCPVRGYDVHNKNNRWFSDEDKEEIKKYKKKYKEWEKKFKGQYKNPNLVKNLLNRKFEFEPTKINLIFGTNASGKTTILKALAGNAGTTDGFPQLQGPIDIKSNGGFGRAATDQDFREYLNKLMINTAEIDWDGAPIYYDNFASRQSYSRIGDLCGSVLGDDIMTEIQYIMEKNQISLGQNSIYLLNRLMDIAKRHLCYADIFKNYVESDGSIKDDMGCNDVWADAYKVQLKYYLGFEKSLVKSPGTFLFDELDKSLDIANIYALYTEVLPRLVDETGVQVIIISHSPLVLSDKIRGSEKYNFISIDEEYTKDCIDNLHKLF